LPPFSRIALGSPAGNRLSPSLADLAAAGAISQKPQKKLLLGTTFKSSGDHLDSARIRNTLCSVHDEFGAGLLVVCKANYSIIDDGKSYENLLNETYCHRQGLKQQAALSYANSGKKRR
jgi:hypothetical protein